MFMFHVIVIYIKGEFTILKRRGERKVLCGIIINVILIINSINFKKPD